MALIRNEPDAVDEEDQPGRTLSAHKRKNRTHRRVRFARKEHENAPGRTRTFGLSLMRFRDFS